MLKQRTIRSLLVGIPTLILSTVTATTEVATGLMTTLTALSGSAQTNPATTPATHLAPTANKIAPEQLERGAHFLTATTGWNLNKNEQIEFDQRLWSLEKLSDGSEIYTLKADLANNPREKRVVLRAGSSLSSISSYILKPMKTKGNRLLKSTAEEAASVLFHQGALYAVTQCHDRGDNRGRDCLTASRNVCEFVRNPKSELPKHVTEELKVLEVRALATILALRGAEHQLDNLARFGDRMGLKDALQTTRGKLTAKDAMARSKAIQQARALCHETALE